MRRNFIQSLVLIVLVGIVSACSSKTVVTNSKPLPPGQQKKITGSQSAKEYTPSQTKKAPAPATKTTAPASTSTPAGQSKKKK